VLEDALSWLLTLALAGGGKKRVMGFARVKVWLDDSNTN